MPQKDVGLLTNETFINNTYLTTSSSQYVSGTRVTQVRG
jgi:hypothetical protein